MGDVRIAALCFSSAVFITTILFLMLWEGKTQTKIASCYASPATQQKPHLRIYPALPKPNVSEQSI